MREPLCCCSHLHAVVDPLDGLAQVREVGEARDVLENGEHRHEVLLLGDQLEVARACAVPVQVALLHGVALHALEVLQAVVHRSPLYLVDQPVLDVALVVFLVALSALPVAAARGEIRRRFNSHICFDLLFITTVSAVKTLEKSHKYLPHVSDDHGVPAHVQVVREVAGEAEDLSDQEGGARVFPGDTR